MAGPAKVGDMSEQRVLPRYRGDVTDEDRRRAEVIAAEAVEAQGELDALREAIAATVRRRNVLIEEANRVGLSQYRLCAMLGVDRGTVREAIREARAAG